MATQWLDSGNQDTQTRTFAPNVQDVVPVVGKKAARFFPVRDSGVRVIRAHGRDVLRVRGEVQGFGGDVRGAAAALRLF